MSTSDDPGLAVRLREEVAALAPAGPGPSLVGIRRRGARRRHVQQAAVTAGVLSLLGAGGAVASVVMAGLTGPGDRPDGYATPATDAAAVIEAVLREHAVASPAYLAGEVVEDSTQRRLGWIKSWQVIDTTPGATVTVSVFPQGQGVAPTDLPCAGDPGRARSCSDVTGPGGVRVVSGITSDDTISGARGRQSRMWAPSAVATHPDGRQVVMTVELLLQPTDTVPDGDVTLEYDGPLTLTQLQAVVTDPDLTTISS